MAIELDLANKTTYLQPVKGLEYPSYYLRVIRSITKKQVLQPTKESYPFAIDFQITKACFRAWAQSFDIPRHQLPPILSYYARLSRDYLFHVLTDLGVNFANIMQLGVDTRIYQADFRFRPNQTYHYSASLRNVAPLHRGRAVLDFLCQIHDKNGALVLEHSDKMFLKNLRESDCTKLTQLQNHPDSYADFMGLSKRSSQVITQEGHKVLPLHLKANAGYQYGKASGDLNPLHTSQIFSRLSGHRGAFVQGLFTNNLVFKLLAHELQTTCSALHIKFTSPIYCDMPALFIYKDSHFEFVDLNQRLLAFGSWEY
ncbi:MAG: MaoC family dehydratase [Oligoflexus sp.]